MIGLFLLNAELASCTGVYIDDVVLTVELARMEYNVWPMCNTHVVRIYS